MDAMTPPRTRPLRRRALLLEPVPTPKKPTRVDTNSAPQWGGLPEPRPSIEDRVLRGIVKGVVGIGCLAAILSFQLWPSLIYRAIHGGFGHWMQPVGVVVGVLFATMLCVAGWTAAQAGSART